MADFLRPNVYWAQDNDKIFLKVDLKEVENPQVNVTENEIHFKGLGRGAAGQQLYQFTLNLYDIIEPKACQYRVYARAVEFKVTKDGGYFWPRLTKEEKKPLWLKIDFDRWKDEDESEEENDLNFKPPFPLADPNIALKELEEKLKKTEALALDEIKKGYLFVYNLLQFIGWLVIGYILANEYAIQGPDGYADIFDKAGGIFSMCQLAAFLEIIHPAIGVVKTGVLAPIVQVYGRNFLLFLVLIPEPKMHGNPAVFWLMVVFTSIELVRYPFYALSSIGKSRKMLTWLRYTIWIPLYPLGILLESYLIYQAIPLYQESEKWSLSLPNAFNISLVFPIWMWGDIGVRLFIGAPMMLNHMYRLRIKKLGGKEKKKKLQ